MEDEVHQRLSAALRAQASGMGSGALAGPAPQTVPQTGAAPAVSPGRGLAKPRLSATGVLIVAALSGAMAGGLAGVISAW